MSSVPAQEHPESHPQDQANAQQELPFALVYGQAVTEMPLDLYIPPDALEVFLEAFEGPLDLLLYLIRKQNIDVLDIPVAEITRQYMGYVELMQSVRLELAAEYLVMAAMLAEIKSRMLLPRSADVEEEEGDPRAELIRRLQEYERFKAAAEGIDELPRVGRDVVVPRLEAPQAKVRKLLPQVSLEELLVSMAEVMRRNDLFESHQITRETLSTRERMSQVLERLKGGAFVPFGELFPYRGFARKIYDGSESNAPTYHGSLVNADYAGDAIHSVALDVQYRAPDHFDPLADPDAEWSFLFDSPDDRVKRSSWYNPDIGHQYFYRYSVFFKPSALPGPTHSVSSGWRPHDSQLLVISPDELYRLGEIFARIVDAKSPFTFTHSRGVARVARRLGERLAGERIDRLVVTPDRVLVIDYKTNRPAPDALDRVDPAYVLQAAVYVAVLKRLYPDRPVEAALVWTDGPKLMPIPQAMLDAALAP